MKSTFDDETYEDCSNDFGSPKFVQCSSSASELVSPDEVSVRRVEIYHAERWSDVTTPPLPDDVENLTSPPLPDDVESVTSPPNGVDSVNSHSDNFESVTSLSDNVEAVTSRADNFKSVTSPSENVGVTSRSDNFESVTSLSDNVEAVTSRSDNVESVTSPPCEAETGVSDTAIANEPVSEMYYTASSEVSLLSDTDIPEKVQEDDSSDERRECVIAGHVAAMRERFESMTRTNTPCPDLARSMSPSLEVFRNITPSPDRLG